MSSLPLVSIMIPTYNQADVVGRAVESALAQTYSNLEIVLADDASTDATREVAERFAGDPRFRYCRNDVRLGRVGNYHDTLYAKSRGKWALNVDGDDYLTDDRFVADAIEAVNGRDGVVMVCGGQRIIMNDGQTKVDLPTTASAEEMAGLDFFLRPFGVFATAHLSTLYRRDLAMQIDFYRTDIVSSDRESLWRLALHGNVILVNRVVGVWRIHGDNTMTKLTARDVTANMAAILAPYEYAVALGIADRRLETWRDRSLATYVVSHAPLVAGGGLKQAVAVLQSVRVYRRAYWLALLGLVSSPRSLITWTLLGIGGQRVFGAARSLWQRLTWEH